MPLKPGRPSGTVKETESLLLAVAVALVSELNAAREEILRYLGGVEAPAGAVVCEIGRSLGEPGRQIPSLYLVYSFHRQYLDGRDGFGRLRGQFILNEHHAYRGR